MSSVPCSSSAISYLSKQRANVIPDNAGKIKKLKLMIEELEKEQKAYIRTNQHLTQNAELIYQQNKVLKDAINDRTTQYEYILDRYSRSTRTLQSAIDNNKKMSKIYNGYKNRASNAKKINDDSIIFNEEIEKFDQEIRDIQNMANDLIKEFYESEKKIFNYKILLSLDSRLTEINKIFTKEAKNCISANSPKSPKLRQKVEKGDEIKKELNLLNKSENIQKLETTEYTLKKFVTKLDRCLSIYNQILLINKKRSVIIETDFDDSNEDDTHENGGKKITCQKAVSKVPKKIDISDEIAELRRIVGDDGFEYLDDRERTENVRKIKKMVIQRSNTKIFGSDELNESEESMKENMFINKNSPFKGENEEEKSNKLNNSDLVKEKSSKKKIKQEKDDDDEEKSQKSKKDKNSDLVKEKSSKKSDKTKQKEKDDDDEKAKNSDLMKEKSSKKKIKQENDDDEEKSQKSKKDKNSDLVKEKSSKKSDKNKQKEKDDKIVDDSEKVNNSEKNKKQDHLKKENSPEESNKTKQKEKEDEEDESKKSEKVKNSDLDNEKTSKKSDKIKQQEKDEDEKVKNSEKKEKHDNLKKKNNLEKSNNIKQEEDSNKPQTSEKQTEKDNTVDNSVKIENPDNLKEENSPEKTKKTEKDEVIDVIIKSEHSEKVNNSEKLIEKEETTENQEKEKPSLSIQKLQPLLVKPEEEANKPEQKPQNKNKKQSNHKHSHKKEKQEHKSMLENKATNTENQNSKQPEKPFSLLVHPIKNRKKSNEKNYKENDAAEEDNESESDGRLEIATNTEISDNSDQPEKNEEETKQPIKTEPIKSPENKPYSLLVHPEKPRKQTEIKFNQKTVEESEIISEYILDSHIDILSENTTVTDKIVHSENQEDKKEEEIKQPEKTEPVKSTENKPYSLLVHPEKPRKQPEIKFNQKTVEESEIVSEYILDNNENDQSEDTVVSEKIVVSNDHSDQDIKEKENKEKTKPAAEKPYSLLVHPNKNRQNSNNKCNVKQTTDESEFTSEYILDNIIGGPSDEATVTDKFNLSNKQEEEKEEEIKQPEKTEPVKSTENKPYSLLVHPEKPRKQATININTKPAEESEYASEYILDNHIDILSENTIATDKIDLSENQEDKKEEEIKQPEKTEPVKSTENKPYSLLVHPEKPRKQTTININTKPADESEYASEYILDNHIDILSENTTSTDKIDLSENKQVKDEKTKQPEKTEPVKSTENKPYSLLVHPEKPRKQPKTNYNTRPAEESEYASEYILDDHLVDISENLINTEKFISSNNKLEKEEEIKQPEKTEPVKSRENKPYSLLVHPEKPRKQPKTNINTRPSEESEYASEYILDGLDLKSESSNNHQENTDVFDQTFYSNFGIKSKEQEKEEEQSKSTAKNPYSLLVYPDKSKIKQQTFNTNHSKYNNESDILSEYILSSPNEESTNNNESESAEFASSSEKLFYSSQSSVGAKSNQVDNAGPYKSPVKKPYSLLVHPNKGRQQTFVRNNNSKSTEDSEYGSEYILEGLVVQSEKAVVTEKFILSDDQSEQDIKSKEENTKQTTEKPYSLLVHPNKNRQNADTKFNAKHTSESEYASEYILDSHADYQSENTVVTEKFILSNKQQEKDIKSKEENTKQTTEKPYSLLVHPNKNRQNTDTKFNAKTTSESEYASEYILDSHADYQSEKAVVTEKFILSNDKPEQNLIPKETAKQSTEKPYSLLVHPNKNRQQTFVQNNSKLTSESEYASEYILDSHADNVSEKAIVSDKFILSNNQPEKEEVTKQTEKTEPTNPSVNKPYSLLVHPEKPIQKTSIKDNLKSTEESEYASEYILGKYTDYPSDKAIITEKFNLSNKQEEETKQPEKTEPTNSSVNKPYSLLVHPEKPRKQTTININSKPDDESEYASEYILDGIEVKIEKSFTSENQEEEDEDSYKKSISSNQSKPNKSPVKKPNSLLVHPNKSRQQTLTKSNLKSTEESEYASEYILDSHADYPSEKAVVTEKYILPNKQQEQDNKSKEEPSKSSTEKPYSLLVHPNKNKQNIEIKINIKSTEESEFTSEYIINCSEKDEPEDAIVTKNDKPEQKEELTQTEKTKPVKKPNSLLVHPNKSRQQTFTKSNQKSTQESEYASEYILDELEEEIEKPSKSIYTNHSNTNTNIKSTKQEEESKSTNKKPNSLLVQPNKNRQQQQQDTKYNIKLTEESEYASEYVLDKNENDSSEKATVTKKFILSNNQTEQNNKSKEIEKLEQHQPPKIHQEIKSKLSTEESTITSEYILDEKSKILEQQSFCSSNSSFGIKSKKQEKEEEQSKSTVKNPYSLLVHPDKNKIKQQTFNTNHSKYNNESDILSEYILSNQNEESTNTNESESAEFASSSEKSFYSSQSSVGSKIKQNHFISEKFIHSTNNQSQQNQNPYSLLVHPDKKNQKQILIDSTLDTKSSQNESEFILEGQNEEEEEYESERAIVTPKFILTNKQTEQKENPQKTNNPYSLLVHPEPRRQSNTNNNRNSTEELENSSDIMLLELEDLEELEEQLEEELEKDEEEEEEQQFTQQPKLPVKKPYSLLVHPNKSRQKSFKIKNNSKSNDEEESEYESEFKLQSNEDGSSEKAIVTEKFILSNIQSQNNTKPEEMKENNKQQNQVSYSLLVHPNKNKQQHKEKTNKQNQTASEESQNESEFILESNEEFSSEKAIVSQKFILSNNNSQQNQKQEEKIETLIKTKSPYSLLVHPDKNNQQKMFAIQYKKSNESDEFDSEFQLDEPSNEQEALKTETTNKQTTKNSNIKTAQQKNKKQQQQKQPKTTTKYDPSIFYASSINVPGNVLDFDESIENVPLKVSLKDIGLEGLDSGNLEKMREMQRLQKLKRDEQKNKSRIIVRVVDYGDRNREKIDVIPSKSDVTCKLTVYEKEWLNNSRKKVDQIEPYFSDEQNNDASNSKPASLLDSTQKAQKTQAIKPKKKSKKCTKTKNSESMNDKNINKQNGKVYRSPRRFSGVKTDSDESKDSVLY